MDEELPVSAGFGLDSWGDSDSCGTNTEGGGSSASAAGGVGFPSPTAASDASSRPWADAGPAGTAVPASGRCADSGGWPPSRPGIPADPLAPAWDGDATICMRPSNAASTDPSKLAPPNAFPAGGASIISNAASKSTFPIAGQALAAAAGGDGSQDPSNPSNPSRNASSSSSLGGLLAAAVSEATGFAGLGLPAADPERSASFPSRLMSQDSSSSIFLGGRLTALGESTNWSSAAGSGVGVTARGVAAAEGALAPGIATWAKNPLFKASRALGRR
mmetsp:Transcript_88780/g.237552  ORF Transcript_88780/g.237552 Transcript_88780/m.237552 type:complete len:275 (-) Transcript_88780:839-1663(-)